MHRKAQRRRARHRVSGYNARWWTPPAGLETEVAEPGGVKAAILPNLVIGHFSIPSVECCMREPRECLKLLQRSARPGEQVHLVDGFLENVTCIGHVSSLALIGRLWRIRDSLGRKVVLDHRLNDSHG
jgi:hypothetical protein